MRVLLASTSTIYGGTYLSYLTDELSQYFKEIDQITFVPYARPSGITHDQYTKMAADAFSKIGKKVVGTHTYENPVEAIEKAQAIFVGGGNTFLLVTKLYELGLMSQIRKAVENSVPYMGTSAGSNIAGKTMQTTNDMPIIYPPSFNTLGLVPFNLNPHYLDPDPNSKHKGETRETRINEFHKLNDIPVVGLREGSWIVGCDGKYSLKGGLTARLFIKDKAAVEVEDLSMF